MTRKMDLLLLKIIGMLVCYTLITCMEPLWAQNNSNDEIMFLRLRLKNDVITLVGKSIRPGKLKSHRMSETGKGLRYVVSSMSGESLSVGFIEDPSFHLYEYEDAEHAGHIKAKMVTVADVEFTVRIPVKTGMRLITFDRVRHNGVQYERPDYLRIGSIDVSTQDK